MARALSAHFVTISFRVCRLTVQGNHYCSRDYGNGSNSYHYSNTYVSYPRGASSSLCIFKVRLLTLPVMDRTTTRTRTAARTTTTAMAARPTRPPAANRTRRATATAVAAAATPVALAAASRCCQDGQCSGPLFVFWSLDHLITWHSLNTHLPIRETTQQ